MKQNTKVEKSITKRIPNKQCKRLEKIGDGDFRIGLTKTCGILDLLETDPSILLFKELEHFSDLVHVFASENHYKHYIDSGMPVVLRKFIKTGKVDIDFLKNVREEKSLDKYDKS